MSALTIAALLVVGEARAGVNTWHSWTGFPTSFAEPCKDDSPSIAAALACTQMYPIAPPAVLCPPAFVAFGPTEIVGWEITTRIRFDSSDPFNCSPMPGTGFNVSWRFTDNCAALDKEWNATYGGCVEICVAPETLNTETGECDPPTNPEPEPTPRHDPTGCLDKGNPCDVVSGNKIQREGDYASAVGTLSFDRTYNGLGDHPAKQGEFWDSPLPVDTLLS